MAKLKKGDEAQPANSFRFNLAGLIVFSLSLGVAAFVVGKMYGGSTKPVSLTAEDIPDLDQQDKDYFTRQGAWGELLTQNIDLERPAEYYIPDAKNPEPETWTFSGLNAAQVRTVLTAGGLSVEEVDTLLAPGSVGSRGTDTVVKPGENFLLSLSPQTRQSLYRELHGRGVEAYIDNPFIFPKDAIKDVCANMRLNSEDVALLKKLMYPGPNAEWLSDYRLLPHRIPTADRRIAMCKALSVQPAVMARVCVRPDTDIDRIANYWGRMDNVRFNDIRPMLETLKALPHGGTASLMLFLPPFARARLYTYPLPPRAGDPVVDCNWSTLNFSGAQPDNRFNDATFAGDFINKNYYPVSAPSVYGDLLLFLNERNEIAHSAVFLADDLAFTKYGNNCRQPWMIVRIADMQAMYPNLRLTYCRRKVN